MTTISIHDAQSKLPELIHAMSPGDEVVITENNQPVARIVLPQATSAALQQPRQSGTLRGTVLHMAPDFNAELEAFKEFAL